jgi:hypothetical protein
MARADSMSLNARQFSAFNHVARMLQRKDDVS